MLFFRISKFFYLKNKKRNPFSFNILPILAFEIVNSPSPTLPNSLTKLLKNLQFCKFLPTYFHFLNISVNSQKQSVRLCRGFVRLLSGFLQGYYLLNPKFCQAHPRQYTTFYQGFYRLILGFTCTFSPVRCKNSSFSPVTFL